MVQVVDEGDRTKLASVQRHSQVVYLVWILTCRHVHQYILLALLVDTSNDVILGSRDSRALSENIGAPLVLRAGRERVEAAGTTCLRLANNSFGS